MSDVAERYRGNCPECGPNRWAFVRTCFTHDREDGNVGIWVSTDHRILQCAGCETVYHSTSSLYSEDIEATYDPITGQQTEAPIRHVSFWPSALHRRRPAWLKQIAASDGDFYSLLKSIYDALDGGLSVLSAIGIRTVLDAETARLDIDPSAPFAKKLNALYAQGFVGETERDILATLIDAGSAAAHRGWRPSEAELDTMMTILEGFLQRTRVLRAKAQELKDAVPAKQTRKPC